MQNTLFVIKVIYHPASDRDDGRLKKNQHLRLQVKIFRIFHDTRRYNYYTNTPFSAIKNILLKVAATETPTFGLCVFLWGVYKQP